MYKTITMTCLGLSIVLGAVFGVGRIGNRVDAFNLHPRLCGVRVDGRGCTVRQVLRHTQAVIHIWTGFASGLDDKVRPDVDGSVGVDVDTRPVSAEAAIEASNDQNEIEAAVDIRIDTSAPTKYDPDCGDLLDLEAGIEADLNLLNLGFNKQR